MILNLLIRFVEIIIGFSGGLAVGAGFVAFLTVLHIIPRLIQLSKTEKYLSIYSTCVIFGVLFGTYLTLTPAPWNQSVVILLLFGSIHGIFNGMLAAALTEVLNVFPILFKRIGLDNFLLWLLAAIVFGKIFGSLFQWLIFVK